MKVATVIFTESTCRHIPRTPRPRWRRIVCLDCIAIYYKHEIMVPGWAVVFGILTFPLWCWFGLPTGLRYLRFKVDSYSRSFHAGLSISEKNTARPVSWRLTPRFLCRDIMSKKPSRLSRENEVHQSRLLGLPYEIRRQIWLEVLHPANELFIKHDPKNARFYAVHEDVKSPTDFTSRTVMSDEGIVLQLPNPSGPFQASTYLDCKDMWQLLGLNHRL